MGWIFHIPSKWRIIDCFSAVELSLTMQYFLSQTIFPYFIVTEGLLICSGMLAAGNHSEPYYFSLRHYCYVLNTFLLSRDFKVWLINVNKEMGWIWWDQSWPV